MICLIKYIILDVDRTMVDSYKPELLSFQEAMENVLGYKISDEETKLFTTMPTNTFLKSLNLLANFLFLFSVQLLDCVCYHGN